MQALVPSAKFPASVHRACKMQAQCPPPRVLDSQKATPTSVRKGSPHPSTKLAKSKQEVHPQSSPHSSTGLAKSKLNTHPQGSIAQAPRCCINLAKSKTNVLPQGSPHPSTRLAKGKPYFHQQSSPHPSTGLTKCKLNALPPEYWTHKKLPQCPSARLPDAVHRAR